MTVHDDNTTFAQRRDHCSTEYRSGIEGLAGCLVADVNLDDDRGLAAYLQTIANDIIEWANRDG